MGTFVTPTYLGDFSYNQTVYFAWSSLNSSGASVAPTGSPTVRVYKNGSTTEDTSTGASTFSFDSKTGINYVTVALNTSFFVPNSEYFIVLDSMTLDGQTVSAVVAQFSIENRSSVAPMLRGIAAAGSSSSITLDSNASAAASYYSGNIIRIVSGTGAGQSRVIYSYTTGRVASVTPNWTTAPDTTSYYQVLAVGSTNLVTINSASSISSSSVVNSNITQIDGNATSGNNATLYLKQLNIVNSAGTAIVASSTGSNGHGISATANGTGKDINAANNTISGNLSGSVGSVTGSVGSVTGNVGGSVGSVTGNVGGNVTGSVGSVSSGVTVSTNNDKTGYRLSSTGVDDVWDEIQSGHSTAGTFGKYLDSSVSGVSTGGLSAGDIADAVWDEARSGHVTSGTFGEGVASVSGSVGSVTGNVGGNVVGSVGSVAGNVGGNLAGSVGSVTGSVGSFGATAISSIKNAVWDDAVSSHTTSGTTGESVQPVYFSDISFLRDDSNTRDEYTITWFKNGSPVLSGITNSNIRVIKRSDGSDLISTTAMTEVGSATGIYKYDSNSGNRTSPGDSYIIVITATIDGSTRTFRKVQGRDN